MICVTQTKFIQYCTALNAFEFKEIAEVHNAYLKMLLEHDETRPRGRRMTATRQHLAHLLKYHPRQPYAPSLIKSRFFSLTTTLLTVLTFLHFETPRVLASGPKNARDIVRKWTPREKYDKYQHFLTNFGLLLSVECSDEVSRKSVESAYPINSLKGDVFL